MPKNTSELEVTKRKVTMTSLVAKIDVDGNEFIERHEAVDYVRPDHLDAYVADARNRWQHVSVSDEPDAGPGGYHGQTAVAGHLDVSDAGIIYGATEEG